MKTIKEMQVGQTITALHDMNFGRRSICVKAGEVFIVSRIEDRFAVGKGTVKQVFIKHEKTGREFEFDNNLDENQNKWNFEA